MMPENERLVSDRASDLCVHTEPEQRTTGGKEIILKTADLSDYNADLSIERPM